VFSAVFTRTLALVRVLPNVRAKLPVEAGLVSPVRDDSTSGADRAYKEGTPAVGDFPKARRALPAPRCGRLDVHRPAVDHAGARRRR